MRRTMSVLAASTMLWSASACSPRVQVIPDPSIPHQVATEAEVEIWARRADGTMARQRVRLLEGWWIAGPPVVEPERAP